MQLDQGQRGFSFSQEGVLDMRMDPASALTAQEIVNEWPEKELAEIFREYGEEPQAYRAARAIVDARRRARIQTTKQLADILSANLRRLKKIHPATLVFQALRICVNDELESIKQALKKAIERLAPGGRIGAISFHSLEDRIVKNVFKEASQKPPKRERRGKEFSPLLHLLTKKPLEAAHTEVRRNPRARSAKLRFAEKVAEAIA